MYQMNSISQTAIENQTRKRADRTLKMRSAGDRGTFEVQAGVVYVDPDEGEHDLEEREEHDQHAADHQADWPIDYLEEEEPLSEEWAEEVAMITPLSTITTMPAKNLNGISFRTSILYYNSS